MAGQKRVVVLAEAGSGKSKELEEQAKALVAAGQFAFYVTVKNVAQRGLTDAVGRLAADRFSTWKSTEQTGWFFIDSVDEAKLDDIRLNDSLNRVADDIGGNLPRAHIVLSGRYNNWEFRTDLEHLERALPIGAQQPELPPEPYETLIRLIHDADTGRRADEPSERPLVVLMAPLDEMRVRKFAEGQGISALDTFMSALDASNLWALAKRPMDLSWLVDYWRKNQRFGRFAEMLDTSVRERLREPDGGRASRDILDADRAFLALERIGATMVFGREAHLELPDQSLAFTQTTPALKLEEVLPDLTGDQQARLLTRPVFDPASLGRVSLHNDNRGVVRGFLAAKWLKHRLEANAPISAVRDLIFGEADGRPIVLPSMRETAAWLSIWNPEIAREVIRREPDLLFSAGDPNSLSASVRTEALKRLVAQLLANERRHEALNRDSLRRFATADLAQAILNSWQQHSTHVEVRKLLLTLVEVGNLKECTAIPVEATSGCFTDHSTVLYGARAIAVTGSDTEVATFVERVKSDVEGRDQTLLWELFDLFFPRFLAVADFLEAVAWNEHFAETPRDIGWRGRNIIERLNTPAELETLLQGLLSESDPEDPASDGTEPETSKERRLAPLIQAAARRLIQVTPMTSFNKTVADAAILLSRRKHHRSSRFEDDALGFMLTATPERRREGLWYAIAALQNAPQVERWGGLTNLTQLEFAGWTPRLQQEDIGWLLIDGREAATPQLRQLTIDGLLNLWRSAGSSADLLDQISEVAALDTRTAAMLKARLAPRQLSPEERKLNRTIAREENRRETERRKSDESWVKFVDGLKADPAQLRTPLSDLKPGYVDGRLYHIWRLLCDLRHDCSEYSINDFGELAIVFGPDLTREAERALVQFWRDRQPVLASSRSTNERSQLNLFDCMAITGISFEAKANPTWATRLSRSEASRAAQLATLELNGFPPWTEALAAAWPEQVRAVFLQEANDHLVTDASQHGFLDKLKYAPPTLSALVAPSIASHITSHPEIRSEQLAKALEIIVRALPVQSLPVNFLRTVLDRFITGENARAGALYLGIIFHAEPKIAADALVAKLDALAPEAQKLLVEHVLPAVFGDRMFHAGINPKVLPFEVLERLVVIAFKTLRFEDDNVHDGAFTPDQRDEAQGARGHLFHTLCMTPGRATLEALKRLQEDPSCPIPPNRLACSILERASEDAEHAPWPAYEARKMELEFDTEPRTPRDLQLVALRRLAEIDHDLHHAEFSQGQTVKALPSELEVQKWFANELRSRQGRAYNLAREPHVVDEKEPDLRFQSNATSASLPIEIKVAESWTFPELLTALTAQLTGRYLRERDKRHGILLLLHQTRRLKGWRDDQGQFLSFEEVVERLKARADELGSEADPAYPKIASVDVSDLTPVHKVRKPKKAAPRPSIAISKRGKK